MALTHEEGISMHVRCYSKSAFTALTPTQTIALVSISDPDVEMPAVDGWGATLILRFYDLEFEADRVKRDGWTRLQEDGLFVKADAMRLNRFLLSDAVRDSHGLYVHCYGGRSRSVAVGKHAAELLGWELQHSELGNLNKTVYALARYPDAFDPPPAASRAGIGPAWLNTALKALADLVTK